MATASAERVLVTPEAVALDLPVADVGTRVGSGLLDGVITYAGLIAFYLAAAGASSVFGAGSGVAAVIWLLGTLTIVFLSPMLMETFWHGQTLGKRITGLRVITVEGTPVRFRQAFLRGVIRFIETMFAPLAVVAILLTPRRQRLGDVLAGTVVVRYRSGMGMPKPLGLTIPHDAVAYVNGLDTSVLARDDLFAIRLLLERTADLRAASAHQLAVDLATRISHKLRAAPTPGMGPRDFLIAVAAAHRQHARVANRRIKGSFLDTPTPAPVYATNTAATAEALIPVDAGSFRAPR